VSGSVFRGFQCGGRTYKSRRVVSRSEIIDAEYLYSGPVGFVVCCLNLGYLRAASGAVERRSGQDQDDKDSVIYSPSHTVSLRDQLVHDVGS
jgi:hypothetical protein